MKFRYPYIIILFLAVTFVSYSQNNIEIGGHIAYGHYIGTLSRKGWNALWYPSAGLDFRYDFNLNTAITMNFDYHKLAGKLSYADNTFPIHTKTSFQTQLISLQIKGEYNFYPYSDKYHYLQTSIYSPFVGLGCGILSRFKPKSVMPYFLAEIGVKYKIIKNINLICSYQLIYIWSEKIAVIDPQTQWIERPIGIQSYSILGQDGIGEIRLGLTWDIDSNERDDCH